MAAVVPAAPMTARGADDAAGSGDVDPSWPRRPKRPQRLGAAVVEDLVDRIVSGDLPQGKSLPTEPELCTFFGLSRTVVREALKLLEEKGLVRVRQGQGTTVAGDDQWNMLDPLVLAAIVRHDDGLLVLDDLVEVRRVLEAQMAGQAAARGSTADFAVVATFLDELVSHEGSPATYVEIDVRFHDAVMRASGNRLAHSVVRTLHAEARASRRYVGNPTVADCRRSTVGHRAVYEALVVHDSAAASKAMDEHILGSWLSRRIRARVRT